MLWCPLRTILHYCDCAVVGSRGACTPGRRSVAPIGCVEEAVEVACAEVPTHTKHCWLPTTNPSTVKAIHQSCAQRHRRRIVRR